MNPSKAKLLKEDEKSYHIEHPELGKFQVAKSGIKDKNVHSFIQGLADGGTVKKAEEFEPGKDYSTEPLPGEQTSEPVPDKTPVQAAPINWNMATANSPSQVGPDMGAEAMSTSPTVPSVPSGAQPGLMGNPSAPAAPQDPYADINKTYADIAKSTEEAAQGSYQSQLAANTAQVAAQKQNAEFFKNYMATYQNNLKNIDDSTVQLMNNYKAGKIDPNRAWNDASTGNKILAAIGVIVGGIGSGLTGQPNQALAVINKQIDRDIEAQKANMDKGKNLLAINMDRYKNLNAAADATRLNHLAYTASTMEGAALKAQPGILKQQLTQQVNAVKLQMAGLQQNLAMANLKNQAFTGQGPNSKEGLPQQLRPYAKQLGIDEETLVPSRSGQSFLAATDKKSAEGVRDEMKAQAPLRGIVSRLENMGLGAVFPVTGKSEEAESLKSQAVLALNQLYDTKRITPESKSLMESIVKNPTSLKELLRHGDKAKQFYKTLDDRLDSAYSAAGLGWANPGGGETPVKRNPPGVL